MSFLVDPDRLPARRRQGWCDGQRQVHYRIFLGGINVEYAFMGENPAAADNRRLKK